MHAPPKTLSATDLRDRVMARALSSGTEGRRGWGRYWPTYRDLHGAGQSSRTIFQHILAEEPNGLLRAGDFKPWSTALAARLHSHRRTTRQTAP